MADRPEDGPWRLVRLNATLFPVRAAEAACYRRYGLLPAEVEVQEPRQMVACLAEADAVMIVSAHLPGGVILAMRRCRIISRLGAGTDKIDVAEATRQGIVISNVPYFCVDEQADHAFALLLALTRQLFPMRTTMEAGAWREARANPRFQRLGGRTLGLVGFGRSARAMAARARGFGLRVLASRRRAVPSPEADRLGVELVELKRLLAESDFVSLHLPLTPETRHMFNEAVLRQMKPGALLINTARGAIVDETALVKVLQEGHLAGAGLDTFAQIDVHSELEVPPDHPLLRLDNVVLTPHVAAFSPEAMYDLAEHAVGNVAAVLRGEWPPEDNIVNPGVQPRFPLQAAG